MVKRAYGPREMMRFKSVPLPWDGEWQRVFGNPEINDMWFISGPSASGKSSFACSSPRSSASMAACST